MFFSACISRTRLRLAVRRRIDGRHPAPSSLKTRFCGKRCANFAPPSKFIPRWRSACPIASASPGWISMELFEGSLMTCCHWIAQSYGPAEPDGLASAMACLQPRSREGLRKGGVSTQAAAAPRLCLRRMPDMPGECPMGENLQREIRRPLVLQKRGPQFSSPLSEASGS